MLQAWHKAGISTWAGYILGFPGDTRESILRDMEIIKKELPLDILELFMLTPLPGSEDHQTLWKQGVWMDPDLNKYDLHHRVVHHPKMSDDEYYQTYLDCWRAYYTPEHIETVARRHGSIKGRNPAEPAQFMTMFKIMFEAEGIHPLEGGVMRMKYRRDRRYGMPIEPVGVFHWKLAVETVKKLRIYGRLAWQGWRIGQRVKNDPKRHEYIDLALTPVDDEDMDKLALFADTAGGEAARHQGPQRGPRPRQGRRRPQPAAGGGANSAPPRMRERAMIAPWTTTSPGASTAIRSRAGSSPRPIASPTPPSWSPPPASSSCCRASRSIASPTSS